MKDKREEIRVASRKGFSKRALAERVDQDPQFAEHYRKAVNESIGDALREARRAADMSQKAVAERMGVSESRVTQIEGTDGASLTLRSLLRFASAIGCRLDIDLVDAKTNQVASSVLVSDDLVPEPSAETAQPLGFSRHSTKVLDTMLADWLGEFKSAKEPFIIGHPIAIRAQPQVAWVPPSKEGERDYAGF